MSYLDEGPISCSTSASDDFIALCKAQINTLGEGIVMDWAGIYLTQPDLTGQTQLVPVVLYPEASQQGFLGEWVPLLSADQRNYLGVDQRGPLAKPAQQIILPLLNQSDVMGLLVVVRNQQNWSERELSQIESSAQIIALARKIDLDCSALKLRMHSLETQQQKQQKYIDDLLHQLRNPVTALRTFARLLMKKLSSQGDEQEIVQGVLREAERISTLLQDPQVTIENTSSLFLPGDAGKLPIEIFSLAELLEPIVSSFEMLAREKGLQLQSQIPQALPQIRANRKGLIEVLSNLIDNAIKYTPSPGEILISAETQAHWVKLLVSDNGYGIPSSEQSHVFERHYRGKLTQTTTSGSGLGLAIVKELLEQMEGRIELISPSPIVKGGQGAGSTFIVWLLSSLGD
jgi:signal transduction histidine kinase